MTTTLDYKIIATQSGGGFPWRFKYDLWPQLGDTYTTVYNVTTDTYMPAEILNLTKSKTQNFSDVQISRARSGNIYFKRHDSGDVFEQLSPDAIFTYCGYDFYSDPLLTHGLFISPCINNMSYDNGFIYILLLIETCDTSCPFIAFAPVGTPSVVKYLTPSISEPSMVLFKLNNTRIINGSGDAKVTDLQIGDGVSLHPFTSGSNPVTILSVFQSPVDYITTSLNCVCPGTKIMTPTGFKLVENINVGDYITTCSTYTGVRCSKKVLFIMTQVVCEDITNKLSWRIKIKKRSISIDKLKLPTDSLYLSAGHSVYTPTLKLALDVGEISRVHGLATTYYNILVDDREDLCVTDPCEIMFANDLPVETLHPRNFLLNEIRKL